MLADKVLGTLYGQAIGDAMGMPSELWSRKRIKAHFGEITDFLDGPVENDAARIFKRGQFTDDTSQALTILDALIKNHFIPDEAAIAGHLIEWAKRTDAFNQNILGPSSKAALLARMNGEDASPFTSEAVTNGAAMRIAPVGCLFSRDKKTELVDYVYRISRVTHDTNAAICGAAMVAMAVSSAVAGQGWDAIMGDVLDISKLAMHYGNDIFGPSLSERLKLGLEFAKKYRHDKETFAQKIYDVIGTGVQTSESVPAALAIAYYAKDPQQCSLLCANLGGDTDTIGAMATAVCGAKTGIQSFDKRWLRLIDDGNQIDFHYYARQIARFRERRDK